MVTVADAMTLDPITAAPDDSLRLARDRMAEGASVGCRWCNLDDDWWALSRTETYAERLIHLLSCASVGTIKSATTNASWWVLSPKQTCLTALSSLSQAERSNDR